ncbi:hypothetical protein R3P38DRAFT_2937502 [Favolaschia claudopus]|uniref:MYND-type domain-containing protein n=1 Tax=Favolaschia claudopus TaxID=2862362 RepID=A0AAW0BR77_9AGAR
MHYSLKLSNLARLPLNIRARAIAAASPTANPEEQACFVDEAQYLSAKDQLPLLPLFYAVLDPVQIPLLTNELRDGVGAISQDDMEHKFFSAIATLRSLMTIVAEHERHPALADLWAHVCPWMQFLDEYGDLVPIAIRDGLTPAEQYSIYVSVCYLFQYAHDTSIHRAMCLSLRPLSRMLGRALSLIIPVEWENKLEKRQALLYVIELLSKWFSINSFDRRAFKELLFGAGGTLGTLASLLGGLCRFCLTDGVSHEYNVQSVHALVLFISATSTHGYNTTVFRQHVWEQGMVTLITKWSIFICSSTLPGLPPPDGASSFEILMGHTELFPPRHRWMAEALGAGALQAAFATRKPQILLRLVLQLVPFTVFRSVLDQCRFALEGVSHMNVATVFVSPRGPGEVAAVDVWRPFLGTVQERLKFMDACDHGQHPVLMSCHNVSCAKIQTKHKFKVCAQCKLAYYCSKACQLQDWKVSQAHRRACRILQVHRDEHALTTSKDTSFLEQVLHETYGTLAKKMALKYLIFAIKNPDKVPYALFDYAPTGIGTVSIGHLEDLHPSFNQNEVSSVSRAKNILFHLVKIPDGKLPNIWLFPLRFGSQAPNFVLKLREIASALPAHPSSEELEAYVAHVLSIMPSWDGNLNSRWWDLFA